jgi:hypothetical protein
LELWSREVGVDTLPRDLSLDKKGHARIKSPPFEPDLRLSCKW